MGRRAAGRNGIGMLWENGGRVDVFEWFQRCCAAIYPYFPVSR